MFPHFWGCYDSYPHYYESYQRVIGTEVLSGKHKNKVSDECVRRGIQKLRKNETLWALLIEEPLFVDTVKVLGL